MFTERRLGSAGVAGIGSLIRLYEVEEVMWSKYPVPTAVLVVLGMLLFAWALYDKLHHTGLLP